MCIILFQDCINNVNSIEDTTPNTEQEAINYSMDH
jgi:hypothetical protein